MTNIAKPTEAEIWHVARAISVPEHHTTWDTLTDRQKDLYFMQAEYAITAMRSSAPQEPVADGCTMGVDCDEAGTCYAAAQGEPERCPRTDDAEAAAWVWLTDYAERRHGEVPEDLDFSPDQMVDAFVAGLQAKAPETD